MANIAPLAPITTSALALSNLVLVTPSSVKGYAPQKLNGPNNNLTKIDLLPSILFNYEGEQTVAIESDITDHFIEDNTALQDQISLKPVTITTHGFIGELNDVAPTPLIPLQIAADKLTVISSYTPVLSTTAILAYNQAFQAYQLAANALNTAVSSWSTINSLITGEGGTNVVSSGGLGTNFDPLTGRVNNNQNKQQIVFQQFFGYWNARYLFTIQTPWAIFQNMAIQRMRAIQDADTKELTDFEITFKQIRIANTATVENTLPDLRQGRNYNQAQPTTDLGTSTPAPSTSLGGALSGTR